MTARTVAWVAFGIYLVVTTGLAIAILGAAVAWRRYRGGAGDAARAVA